MKQQRPRETFEDIRAHDAKKHTVSLRERKLHVHAGTWHLSISKRQAVAFVQRHKAPVALVAVLVAVAGISLLDLRQSHADTAILYPQSCLGGWTDPAHAAGAPATEESAPEDIDATNSASLMNTHAELFCGNFAGDMPTGTKPSHITLVPYWRITDDPTLPPSSRTEPGYEEIPVDLLPAEDAPQEEMPGTLPPVIPEGPPAPEDLPADVPAPEPAQEPAPEAAPEPSAASPDTSFEGRLVRTAYAQTGDDDIEALADEEIDSTPDTDILQLRYSFDGSSWTDLGTVSQTNWRDATFEIPGEDPTWAQIQSLQISVSPLPTLDKQPAIYIDGFVLEVDYEKTAEELLLEEASSTPPIDPASLRFRDITVDGLPQAPVVMPDGAGEKLVVKGLPDRTLSIYQVGEDRFSFTSGIGNAPLELPTYFFGPGSYIGVVTNEPSGCASFDLATCQEHPNTGGSFSFTIFVQEPIQAAPSSSTTVPGQAASPPLPAAQGDGATVVGPAPAPTPPSEPAPSPENAP